jgi:hypothetical protein
LPGIRGRAGELGQVSELGVHSGGIPVLLAQRCLAHDQVHPDRVLVHGDTLAGEHGMR